MREQDTLEKWRPRNAIRPNSRLSREIQTRTNVSAQMVWALVIGRSYYNLGCEQQPMGSARFDASGNRLLAAYSPSASRAMRRR